MLIITLPTRCMYDCQLDPIIEGDMACCYQPPRLLEIVILLISTFFTEVKMKISPFNIHQELNNKIFTSLAQSPSLSVACESSWRLFWAKCQWRSPANFSLLLSLSFKFYIWRKHNDFISILTRCNGLWEKFKWHAVTISLALGFISASNWIKIFFMVKRKNWIIELMS
jgi:hypothetical protein